MINLLKAIKYAINKKRKEKLEEIRKIYQEMMNIKNQVDGNVMSINDLIDRVENNSCTIQHGYGYYWDEEKQEETEFHTSFNVEELKKKAKQYKYVVWYNK